MKLDFQNTRGWPFFLFALAVLWCGFWFGRAVVYAIPRTTDEIKPRETVPSSLWTPANEIHELPEPQMPEIEPGREIQDGPMRNASYSFVESASDMVSVDGWQITRAEAEIVQFTNEYRVRCGRKPLKVSRKLMGTSRMQAWLQIRRGMSHHLGPFKGAENIAMIGGGGSPRAFVNMWINSTGHRNNMLANHAYIGVGCYGGQACQQFE